MFDAVRGGGSSDIYLLQTDTQESKAFIATPFEESHARFSPDGRWIAYKSDRSGRDEIYVQPFTNYDVSLDGRRFIMVRENNPQLPTVIHVVLNWPDALRRSNR